MKQWLRCLRLLHLNTTAQPVSCKVWLRRLRLFKRFDLRGAQRSPYCGGRVRRGTVTELFATVVKRIRHI